MKYRTKAEQRAYDLGYFVGYNSIFIIPTVFTWYCDRLTDIRG